MPCPYRLSPWLYRSTDPQTRLLYGGLVLNTAKHSGDFILPCCPALNGTSAYSRLMAERVGLEPTRRFRPTSLANSPRRPGPRRTVKPFRFPASSPTAGRSTPGAGSAGRGKSRRRTGAAAGRRSGAAAPAAPFELCFIGIGKMVISHHASF